MDVVLVDLKELILRVMETLINFLSTDFFRNYDVHLIFTGVTRNSKTVLKDVTSNIDKSLPLLDIVDEAHQFPL